MLSIHRMQNNHTYRLNALISRAFSSVAVDFVVVDSLVDTIIDTDIRS